MPAEFSGQEALVGEVGQLEEAHGSLNRDVEEFLDSALGKHAVEHVVEDGGVPAEEDVDDRQGQGESEMDQPYHQGQEHHRQRDVVGDDPE